MKIVILLITLFNISFGYYKIVPGKRPKSIIDNLPFGKVADMVSIPKSEATMQNRYTNFQETNS